MPELLVIRSRKIDRCKWVAARNPVLQSENRCTCLCVLEEKRIVPHTEAKKNVQICLFIEQSGLEDRIAQGFLCTLENLFLIFDSDLLLRGSPGFIKNRDRLLNLFVLKMFSTTAASLARLIQKTSPSPVCLIFLENSTTSSIRVLVGCIK